MKIILPTWLGSFYGADFDYIDYETITINKFHPLNLGNSLAMKSRWFDYQRLHPLQATYYFYDCFNKISDKLSRKYFGKPQGSKFKDFTESREKNSFWMLRHFCDLHGFSYLWFLYTMIEYRLQSGEFKNRLPRPQHILKDNEEEIYVLDRMWADRFCGEPLQVSIDPYFRVERWEQNPIQIKHEDYLIGQVKRKRIKHYALKSLVYDQHLLRFERVLMEFPEEIADMQKDCSAPIFINE